MAVGPDRLRLQIEPAPDADAEELAQLATELQQQVLELNIESADLEHDGEPPRGAKALEALDFGTLIVTLTQSLGPLSEVVTAVGSWLSQRPVRSVRLELNGDVLEMNGLSSVDQRRLIDEWIKRHSD
jgi:hypothetical protein